MELAYIFDTDKFHIKLFQLINCKFQNTIFNVLVSVFK